MELILLLHNIRSCHNVGSILRTAEGFGVKKVIFSGYTPRPHDRNLLPHLRAKLDKEIQKTALGAEDMLDCEASSDIASTINELRSSGHQILGLENNLASPNLITLDNPTLHSRLSHRAALLLGEEVSGIDKGLHPLVDLFLEIPMRGHKESFNVSVATGIALYELTKM